MVQQLFNYIDVNNDGVVNFLEFQHFTNSEAGRAYLSGLDLNVNDAWTLLKLIDVEGKQCIDLDSLVSGCLRLKGTAKSVDMARQNPHFLKMFEKTFELNFE